MRFQSQGVLTGIKTSKGEYEGRPFDSTTFHLAVDLPDSQTGDSVGQVTRPFKMGTSAEFKKWAHLKNSWPAGGIQVDCTFEMAAGADQSSKLVLVDIRPHKAA
ncbi:hypothetical protein V8Z74_17125 [Comamonas sp. w2-DMI]|uniref:hypothetical protein n=1 Tax=Comamonas sp. w2-DMI TaxID=3126391 RepID=UPI0032E436A6